MTVVHAVVPDGIDDPRLPSGGNVYDRRVIDGLRKLGREVQVHAVPGAWPDRRPAALSALRQAVARARDGEVVLVDGLIGSAAPDVLVPEAGRVRLAVLVHMPLGQDGADGETRSRERAVLRSAAAVIATSGWSRNLLLRLYRLAPERVHVAAPGVDAAPAAAGMSTGGALLCVGAVIPGKGHDVLLDALQLEGDLAWSCVCVGTLERDPAFAQSVRTRAGRGAIAERIRFEGAVPGRVLERRYAEADLLVLPSRGETYGMVVTEALARGVPVIASDVGGVPEALGRTPAGIPGVLVPPGSAGALAAALHGWLSDAPLRAELRAAAAERRRTLAGWAVTTSRVDEALASAAA